MVINYNYYRPDFKSEVLLFCKNYDNLAFLLGEFSDFSYAARSICYPRMRISSQLRAGSSGLAYKKCWLADTIPLSAVIWAPEVVDGRSIVLPPIVIPNHMFRLSFNDMDERRTGTGIGYYFPPLPVSWPQYHVLLYLLYLCFVAFTTSPCTTARHRSTAPGTSLCRRLHQDQDAPTKEYRPPDCICVGPRAPGKMATGAMAATHVSPPHKRHLVLADGNS